MLIHDVMRSVSEINDVLIVVDVPVLVLVVAGLEVDAQDLHSSCKRFVPTFLLASPLEFFLIPALLVHRHSPYLGWVHVVQAIGLDGFVVEPWAVTSFPFQATNHAELCTATTGHVVTAFLQFDRRGAVEAALPAFLFGNLRETLRGLVFGAFATRVPFSVASAADFGSAAATFPIFTATVGASRGVEVDVCGFNPFAASSRGAVDTVFRGVFLVLLIPLHLELCIKKLLDMLQRNVILGAAFWGHMLRVSNG